MGAHVCMRERHQVYTFMHTTTSMFAATFLYECVCVYLGTSARFVFKQLV